MGRKVAFSAKAKKEQLQAKRARKRGGEQQDNPDTTGHDGESAAPNPKTKFELLLHHKKESKAEIMRRIKECEEPLTVLKAKDGLEVTVDELHNDTTRIFLARPPWEKTDTVEALNQREKTALIDYIQQLRDSVDGDESRLCYFERNLETWRQLWRVIEISDVFLYIVDIRFAGQHFSPALYMYLTKKLKKPFILAFNKCDLVPEEHTRAWTDYFREHFPAAHIVAFSNHYPVSSKKKFRNRLGVAKGVDELIRLWKELQLPGGAFWEAQFNEWSHDTGRENSFDGEEDEDDQEEGSADETKEAQGEPEGAQTSNTVTLALLGQTNVGKSTILNSILGKHVVQASSTPGKTKYLQTHYVTPDIVLCDSPGIILPSLVSRAFQVLGGLYRISECREPFSAVNYLASRVNLISELKLQPSKESLDDGGEFFWSAYRICESYAEKKHFVTAKSGRLDVSRAAREMLSFVITGRILLAYVPRGFHSRGKSRVLMDCEEAGG
eukprot:m.118715 g.118715  ORF g.118715 m.118715 type:complete len:497 (-) comp14287_c0_seq4:127-1617(-)